VAEAERMESGEDFPYEFQKTGTDLLKVERQGFAVGRAVNLLRKVTKRFSRSVHGERQRQV
jgi:hypothetical protein